MKNTFNQGKTWSDNIEEWAQKSGLYRDKDGLGTSPSFSGIYQDYQCALRLIPIGFGTNFVFLSTRIEVYCKNDTHLITHQKNNQTEISVDFTIVKTTYRDSVRNLLNTINRNKKTISETLGQLSLFSDKISLTLNENNFEAEHYKEAFESLILLARQLDQLFIFIKSSSQSND